MLRKARHILSPLSASIKKPAGVCCALLVYSCHSVFAAPTTLEYVPPVSLELALAGNFGEPRPNHFHGGLDIKTGGHEGEKIMTVADGYVSRVSITPNGFGNAVYVTHPDGHTSVYAHLRSFSPRIAALVKRWRYRHKQPEGEMRFNAEDCPVSQGEIIAVSGNTGSSQGPHLHLEIHDTKSWAMLDPLEFIGKYFTDGQSPMAHAFMAYPKEGEGSFSGLNRKSLYGFSSRNLSTPYRAWGKVGFGIWANDYMEITYNKYGIRHTELKVDGRTVFKSDVNGIPAAHNRMVNSWGDFEHFRSHNVWYMKAFVLPGNRLPILWADKNGGWVDFNEEREYSIVFTLTDYAGNSVDYSFKVKGVPQELPGRPKLNGLYTAKYNATNAVQMPGMQLIIPSGLLEEDVEIEPQMSHDVSGLSRRYSFRSNTLPLFGYAELSIKAPENAPHPDKLYLVADDGMTALYVGNTNKDGWISGRIRDIDKTYYLKEDLEAPIVTMTSPGGWASHKKITACVYDHGSGVKSFEAYIDGHFVLFTRVKKSDDFECRLDEAPVKKTSSQHRLKFVATDMCGNTSVKEVDFIY